MKRTLVIIVALILVFSLVACSSSSTEIPSLEKENMPAEDSNASEEIKPTESKPNDPEPKSDGIAFEELVVVDNDECTVKITGIEPDNMWGYTLKVNLENKSADKTYMFSTQSGAVNGVESDPFFATEVAPGKKSNNDMSFMDDTLKNNGINEFTDIELTFKVYDTNDWTSDPVALETVHVYPLGEEKATKFVRESQSTDTVLIDDENIYIVVMGYTNDSIWGYTVNLYLENRTDKTLTYAVDEVSVNGYMADPFWAKEVRPGNVAFTSMSWSDTVFEENEITEVEEIEMLFKVYDSNDWMADKLIEEIVVLNP